jgi:hypothetical protein
VLHAAAEDAGPPLSGTCPEIPEVDEEHLFSGSSSEVKNYRDRVFSASGLDRFSFIGDSEPGVAGTKDTDEKRSHDERRSEGWNRQPRPILLGLEEQINSLKSSPSAIGGVRSSYRKQPQEPVKNKPFSQFGFPVAPMEPSAKSMVNLRTQSDGYQGHRTESTQFKLGPKGNAPRTPKGLAASSQNTESTRKLWDTLFASRNRPKGSQPCNSGKFSQRSLDRIHLNTKPLQPKTKSSTALSERVVRFSTAMR